jgi:hypothetical protein
MNQILCCCGYYFWLKSYDGSHSFLQFNQTISHDHSDYIPPNLSSFTINTEQVHVVVKDLYL